MAHIKLEAALETSNKWLITDVPLLSWRKKLKCAAQECDDTLHKCKQRVLEDEQIEQEIRNSSLGKQITHATKSFIFSIFSRNDNELRRSNVRRFEWYADGASEFLRFIEHGGTPRCHMPFDSLIKHLFAGKLLHHKIVQKSNKPLFLLSLVPFSTAEHGIEVCLVFVQKDCNASERPEVFFSLMLQLLESTDIIGIAIKCLQLFTPHFKSAVEVIEKALTQLPTQDFSWLPYGYLWQRELWDNFHSFITQWLRPDPLCCSQYDQQKLLHSNLDIAILPDVSLERVIEVSLQCEVSLSEYSKQRTSLSECKNSLQGSPHLKALLSYRPHESSGEILPVDKNSAVSGIHGEEQHCLHTNITFEELKEIMLPKAIDYFHRNIEAIVYQMIWKSKHGTAYIQVEKAGMKMPSERRTSRAARKRKLVQRQDQEPRIRARMASRFLNLWVAHVPIRLRGLILNWIQKEKESKLAAAPLHL